MCRILITGGAGFVGANLALLLKQKYPHWHVIALDNLKRRGSELNLPLLRSTGVEFVHGDVRNKEDLQLAQHVDFVIDAAAEPSILAGLSGQPDYLVHTNLNGTIHSLDFANQHKAKFIFLSTSRVYPIKWLEALDYYEDTSRFELNEIQKISGASSNGVAENFPLDGARSFYGTTKLASELMAQEYQMFYGLKTIVNRCGVIAGPRQMGKVDQGVVVLWMARHFWKKELAYIGYGGSGKQVRDVIHILDLFDLVDYQLENFDKLAGGVYNVGGGRKVSFSLLELTQLCSEITGNYLGISKISENRTGDVPIYITDHSKITNITGLQPTRNLTTLLVDVFEWIKKNEQQLKNIFIE